MRRDKTSEEFAESLAAYFDRREGAVEDAIDMPLFTTSLDAVVNAS